MLLILSKIKTNKISPTVTELCVNIKRFFSEKHGHVQLLRLHKNDRFKDSDIRGPNDPSDRLYKEQKDVESGQVYIRH